MLIQKYINILRILKKIAELEEKARTNPEYIDVELTDDEIEEYRKGGYVVEELPTAQKGLHKRKYLKGHRKQNKRYGWGKNKKRNKKEEVEEIIEETPIEINYNLPDADVLSQGDENIKIGLNDKINFLTSDIYYQNTINTYGSEEEAQKVIQNQLNRIGDVNINVPNQGDDYNNPGATAYFRPETNSIHYDPQFAGKTTLQHLTGHEIDHKTAVQGMNPDGSPILYPEFECIMI